MQSDVDRGRRPLLGAAPFVQVVQACVQDPLGLQRAGWPLGWIVGTEQGEVPAADQLQHVAAGFVDRGDHSFGVVVEQGNDLAGRRRVGDRRVAAQVGEPQSCIDAIGHTALDAAFEHAPAGIAAR